MRTAALRLLARVLLVCVAFGGFIASPVGASTPAQWAKFSGVYRFHVGTADGKFGGGTSFVITFVNGSGSDPSGDQVRWSHSGRHFHFTVFPLSEAWFVVGDGIRNRNGLSSRKNPGTFTQTFTDDFREVTSTWFAVKLRDASTG